MTIANTRIQKELKQFHKGPPPVGIALWMPDESDVTQLRARPADTPYEGGEFHVSIRIPPQHPFSECFTTPIYHPNIDEKGLICMDLLKMPPQGGWKPSMNVGLLLMSLHVLLQHPNPDDPLRADVAQLYRTDTRQFNDNARQWTLQHAIIPTEKGSKRPASPPLADDPKRQRP